MAGIGNSSLYPSALQVNSRRKNPRRKVLMLRTFLLEAEPLFSIPGYLLRWEGAYFSLMNMKTPLFTHCAQSRFKIPTKASHACLDHCSIACSYCDKYSQSCLQRNHPPLTSLSFHSLPISQTPNERTIYFSFFFGRSWLVWPHFFFLQLVARGGRRACI
jgi:hypothetical protein